MLNLNFVERKLLEKKNHYHSP